MAPTPFRTGLDRYAYVPIVRRPAYDWPNGTRLAVYFALNVEAFEFGRSPGDGGGHFCNAWSTVWAGGGIKTGQVIGKTTDTGKNPGTAVADRPISAPDYVATLCLALGIDIHQEFIAPGNRPMPLADKSAKPITELLS